MRRHPPRPVFSPGARPIRRSARSRGRQAGVPERAVPPIAGSALQRRVGGDAVGAGVQSCHCGYVAEVVVVSGAPGAGRSTLAAPLARDLGFPLIAKDVIKESLFDSLGQLDADPLASSWRLGGAAMELLWRLAEECPSVVIEANFRSHSVYERQRLRALSPRPVEVYCRLPVEQPAERYARRGTRSDPHPVHVTRSLPVSAFHEFQEPMGLGPCWRSTPRRRSTCQHWPSRS